MLLIFPETKYWEKESFVNSELTKLLQTIITSNIIGDATLETLLSENANYVLKLSQLVLQESNREKTRLYANLILSQGYIRVVIEEMIEEGIRENSSAIFDILGYWN